MSKRSASSPLFSPSSTDVKLQDGLQTDVSVKSSKPGSHQLEEGSSLEGGRCSQRRGNSQRSMKVSVKADKSRSKEHSSKRFNSEDEGNTRMVDSDDEPLVVSPTKVLEDPTIIFPKCITHDVKKEYTEEVINSGKDLQNLTTMEWFDVYEKMETIIIGTAQPEDPKEREEWRQARIDLKISVDRMSVYNLLLIKLKDKEFVNQRNVVDEQHYAAKLNNQDWVQHICAESRKPGFVQLWWCDLPFLIKYQKRDGTSIIDASASSSSQFPYEKRHFPDKDWTKDKEEEHEECSGTEDGRLNRTPPAASRQRGRPPSRPAPKGRPRGRQRRRRSNQSDSDSSWTPAKSRRPRKRQLRKVRTWTSRPKNRGYSDEDGPVFPERYNSPPRPPRGPGRAPDARGRGGLPSPRQGPDDDGTKDQPVKRRPGRPPRVATTPNVYDHGGFRPSPSPGSECADDQAGKKRRGRPLREGSTTAKAKVEAKKKQLLERLDYDPKLPEDQGPVRAQKQSGDMSDYDDDNLGLFQAECDDCKTWRYVPAARFEALNKHDARFTCQDVGKRCVPRITRSDEDESAAE